MPSTLLFNLIITTTKEDSINIDTSNVGDDSKVRLTNTITILPQIRQVVYRHKWPIKVGWNIKLLR